MRPDWETEAFEVFDAGVSSALDPRLIKPNQLAWGQNISLRGGTPKTRPSLKYRLTLPEGLFQGIGYFSVQGGMFVASIGGRIYRIRINGSAFSSEEIPLSFENSSALKQAWFCQTVEHLIIQDGQSNPIFYDGNIAKRSDVTGLVNQDKNDGQVLPQVPLGRQMAYGNGRLWVATGNFNLVAGDIRTDQEGSELYFTENTYLNGGGALYFPRGINGMAFLPTTGGGDYGALVVFGKDYAETVRADISSRDMWAQIPGFVTTAMRTVGCAGQWSISEVNQDIYWRDGTGGIRSLRAALSDEESPGNAPLSREVSRITDYESDQLLGFCSSILADNRLLVTANPFLLPNGGVGFKSIISLDFANISTMQGKSPPAYDGVWTGLRFQQLINGAINGAKRSFVVSHDDDGQNRLWEIVDKAVDDITIVDGETTNSAIVSSREYGRRSFGDPRRRKRLERCDVFLADVNGEVDIKVYWRTDNNTKWRQWDETTVCAKTDDATTDVTPHVFKLLPTQQRPQVKTFTIPTGVDEITRYALHVGFEFQIRIVITGRCRIYRVFVHASPLVDQPFAELEDTECLVEDITGNTVNYEIPVSGSLPELAVKINGSVVNNNDTVVLYTGVDYDVDLKRVGGTNQLFVTPSSTGDVVVAPESSQEIDQTTFEPALTCSVVDSGTLVFENSGVTNPFTVNVERVPQVSNPITIIQSWAEGDLIGDRWLKLEQLTGPDRAKFTYFDGGAYNIDTSAPAGQYCGTRISTDGINWTDGDLVLYGGSFTYALPIYLELYSTNPNGPNPDPTGISSPAHLKADNLLTPNTWELVGLGYSHETVMASPNIFTRIFEEPTQFGNAILFIERGSTQSRINAAGLYGYTINQTDGGYLQLFIKNGTFEETVSVHGLSSYFPNGTTLQLSFTSDTIPRMSGLHGTFNFTI